MDREKLNKAAVLHSGAVYNSYPEDVTDDTLEYECHKSFLKGADWLMQQPLADRLTDEEKEKIKAIYFRNVYSVADVQSNFTEKCLIDAIFDEELFK